MRRILFSLLLLLLAAGVMAEEKRHVVRPGDTLSKIAKATLGSADAWPRIAQLNGLTGKSVLKVGQRLLLPPEAFSGSGASARPSFPGPPAAPQEFLLAEFSGKAEIVRETEALAFGIGSRFRPGDTLRLGRESRLLLSATGGERLILEDGAVATLKELSSGLADRRISLRLEEGRVRFSAPVTPFLTRYLFETPTGAISMRSGEIILDVIPPEHTSVSFLSGRGIANLPLGQLDIPGGWGAALKTLEKPQLAQPLPRTPGITYETAPRILVLAAATEPGAVLRFEIFSDPDERSRVGVKTVPSDGMGVAVTRFVLPESAYWISVISVNPDGLVSLPARAGPVHIEEKLW